MNKTWLATAALTTALAFSATSAYAQSEGPAVPNEAIMPISAVLPGTSSPDATSSDVPALPIHNVYDANGNVIGQTRTAPDQKQHLTFAVNGNPVDLAGSEPYYTGDKLMVPLRAIAEALGYEVVWHQDTYSVDVIRGAVWSGIRIGADAFAFGKMAPMPLGTPAELTEGVTYVPLAFFGDVLRDKREQDQSGAIAWTTERP